ncbi:MAG: hypothetical protein AAFV98_00695 [Chloroflexota bacterium]
MPILIDNQYVTLQYHEDTKIVHHIYHHGIAGDYLKNALMRGTEALKKHNAVKWLSDNRAIDGVTDEESAWINDVWLPHTMKAGWKFWALVVPEKAHPRINMVQFVTNFANQGVLVRVFTDDAPAMQWLKSLTDNDAVTSA